MRQSQERVQKKYEHSQALPKTGIVDFQRLDVPVSSFLSNYTGPVTFDLEQTLTYYLYENITQAKHLFGVTIDTITDINLRLTAERFPFSIPKPAHFNEEKFKIEGDFLIFEEEEDILRFFSHAFLAQLAKRESEQEKVHNRTADRADKKQKRMKRAKNI